MPVQSYIQAITAGLREEMLRDERFVLGEDVGKKVAFSVLRKVFMKRLANTVCLIRRSLNQP